MQRRNDERSGRTEIPATEGHTAEDGIPEQRTDALLDAAFAARAEGAERQLEHALRARDSAAASRDVVSTIAATALAAEAAGNLHRYEDAVRYGLETLAHAKLSATGTPETWDAALAALDKETATLAADGATALAIAAFRMAAYSDSLRYAQLELHLRRHLGDEVGEANALNGLGWCYDKVGLFQQALASQFRALDAIERARPERVAGPLNGIAATYLNLGHADKAIAYGRRALDAAPASPTSERERSTALRTIGQGHQMLGDHDAAKDAYQQSHDVSDAYGRSLALLSLGDLFLDQGRPAEALAQYRACLRTLRPEARRRALCAALVGVGRAQLALGETEAALVPLREAVARGEASGAPVETSAAHQALSEALKRLGRWQQSLEHFEAYHAVHDTVLRELCDLRTQVLTIQFDVDRLQKDREIDRLRNVELARAYADLRELNQQLERQAARLEHLSRTDELTDLPNRRAFDERMNDELHRSARNGRPLSVLMVDLDDFKAVNDTHTHVVGDAVLKSAAGALLAVTRDVDICARIGGEEFVVLLPETDEAGATHVAEKIVAAIHEAAKRDVGVQITASVGIATLDAGETAEALVARADAMLYRAKRSGKNRVQA